jgi:diguanylate cyclase (GGDEF)-like protein/PAS domain S-box-containing protein
MVENANDAIVVAQDGIVKFANAKALQVSGYSLDQLVGQPFAGFLHPEDREVVSMRHQIGLQCATGRGLIYPFRIRARDGSVVWVEINPVSIAWEGRPATLNLLSDITERRQAEQTIMHLAYHDPLTGLPNRMLLNDRLTVCLAQARRNVQRFALILVDLDGFKNVNDTRGHAAGDELLSQVGQRLRRLLRESDTVARMGGDEFMLLLPELVRREHAETVADKVLECISRPFQIGRDQIEIRASLGIAVYPDDGDSSDVLMHHVDQAMYSAKQAGVGRGQ